MKNIVLSIITLSSVFFFSGCNQEISTPKVEKVQKSQPQEKIKVIASKVQNNQLQEDIRVMASNNSQDNITVENIEKAFQANGFLITGNNNMSTSFQKRFGGKKDYKMYRLMFVYHPAITTKLLKEYPEFGLLAPLSTSVYSKDGETIHISSLSLTGMSRISGVPETNVDLIELHNNMTKSLKTAMPNGNFQKLNFKIQRPDGEIITRFAFNMTNESGDIEEAKESYQEVMEGEIESNGFIVAGFNAINEDLTEKGINDYDFYDSYSICKLEVIYPVHKLHPEVGALAPCTMYMYKKKGEKFTRMGYPSVYNWIMTTNIKDEESITPLIDAQNLLESTIDSTIE